MNMTGRSLRKFLVVPTFVARHLHLCRDARDPSGECWKYLTGSLCCNFPEKTTSRPFRDLFLATNIHTRGRRPQLGYVLRMCNQNMTRQPHK